MGLGLRVLGFGFGDKWRGFRYLRRGERGEGLD
jgi:hypothetical protein